MSASIPWRLEGLAGQLGVLGADAQAAGSVGHRRRQLGQRVGRRVGTHGEDDPGRVGGVLGVGELAERDDLAPPLLDAVPPGDAEVEQPVGHVDRDLLGPQDPHLVDPGVVDRGAVGDIGGAVDGQVGVLEQLHGGAFERALGQDEAEHGGRSSQTAPAGRAGPCAGRRAASWAGAPALRRPQFPAAPRDRDAPRRRGRRTPSPASPSPTT